MPKPNQTEATETDTTPSTVDLIAAAVGATEDDGATPVVAETPAEEVAPEAAEPEAPEAAEGDLQPDGAASAPVAAAPAEPEDPDAAAVTKEMADLGITKPDSQARFRELAAQAKEGSYYRERFEQQQEVFNYLEKNSITGEQFGLMTMIAGDVNSNDPVRLKRAHDALSAELAGLSKMLGIEAAGFDPLSAHPDLLGKVNEGEMDRATALAWAKDRSQAHLATQNQQRQQQQETATQLEDRARQDLTALGQQLQQKDPFYDKVYALLVPALKPVLARTQPADWVNVTAEAYGSLRRQLAAAGQLVKDPPKPPVVKRPDPSNAGRPNGSATGTVQSRNTADLIMAQLGLSPEN